MKKTWIAPKAEELTLNATQYGCPDEKVDWCFLGIPLSEGPNDEKPGGES